MASEGIDRFGQHHRADGLTPAASRAGGSKRIALVVKPDLILHPDDLTATARELAELIAESGDVFHRGGPARVLQQPGGSPPRVLQLDPHSTVVLAHELARPVLLNGNGGATAKTLPHRVAQLYLALGDCGLQSLKGVSTAPLLLPDGSIRTVEGYDPLSGFWCAAIPMLEVSDRPTEAEARTALRKIRETFRTFPFADAIMLSGSERSSVDVSALPKHDESVFLCGLLTAICRSSLPLAPGLLITAPFISGAGTGKGQLVRAISAIAYGIQPHAFTTGRDAGELEKRIGAALMEGMQIVFVDNVNNATLRSDLLASVLTERLVDVRPLGHSRMLTLYPSAFVAITGNGVSLTEDLARRFLLVQLDAHTPDPEARSFPPGFLDSIIARRHELLNAALTIWRWGRQSESVLRSGLPLGSYEEWCRWVRDPLLTLGCADPIERLRVIKMQDPMRRGISEIYEEWSKCHETSPVKAAELSPSVVTLIDPQGRGRQFVASEVAKLVGTSVGGLQLTAQRGAGRWSATTYALRHLDL